MSMVVPSPHGLFPERPPLDGPDTWLVRVPWAHISDSSPHRIQWRARRAVQSFGCHRSLQPSGAIGLDDHFSGTKMFQYNQRVPSVGVTVHVALAGSNAFSSFENYLGGSLPPI